MARDQSYRVILPGRPREIVLDPDYEVFRRPAVQEITPTIDRLLTRPNAVVVAPTAQAERFAALPDILAAGEATLNLQWRQGPLKHRPGSGVPDSHWRAAFDPHRSVASNIEMRDASLILLGQDNPMIGRLFGNLPRHDAEFAVTIRTRPGNPRQVVALVTAEPGSEWKRDAAMAMNDYRRYSALRFRDGKLVYKSIAPSQRSIRVELP